MGGSKIAAYGSWKSPITADLIVAGTVSLSDLMIDGGDIYWIEMRPAEAGRGVIVRRTASGRIEDVTPSGFNARTRVHEYGGGAFAVSKGTVCFSNFNDNRLYVQRPGSEPKPLSPAADMRYADGQIDQRRGKIICVREDHAVTGEPENALVSIDLITANGDQPGRVIVSGNDFCSSPTLSPDGGRLAWLAWNHPNMPWDGCEVWVGHLDEAGSVIEKERIAGGGGESIFQPQWSPDGVLHFISDRTGWWNLYRHRAGTVEPLCPMEAEFGVPQWMFGLSTYAFESPARIACTYNQRGQWNLGRLDTTSGTLDRIESSLTEIRYVRAGAGAIFFYGGSPVEAAAIVSLNTASGQIENLRRSSNIEIEQVYLSIPQAIEFTTAEGKIAHAFFYPPKNADYSAPEGEKPPLLVTSHGGPTWAASTVLAPGIQFWTSRGIGFLDVNYRGSTGYGTEYRRQLNGQWGIADVDDCAYGARYVVDRGLADGDRLIIRGGSAGGYTTLAALTFRDVFKAGASYYGVSDLEVLEEDTHKFESKYSSSLVGPYPQRRDLYFERSPIHFTEQLSCPLILFQGLEDKVVPPNQAEMMYDAVKKKGLPVAYVPFAGEQHGFRRAENIKRALEAELYFYSRVFGFDPADEIEPVEIANLR